MMNVMETKEIKSVNRRNKVAIFKQYSKEPFGENVI